MNPQSHHPSLLFRIFPLLVLLSAAANEATAATFMALTPADNLQAAISAIDGGGVIELGAGTYTAPAAGFAISNPNRHFTIRAAEGAVVIIEGGGGDGLFEYLVSNTALRGHVTFEDIIFRNGAASNVNRAGALTTNGGAATFIRCQFLDNSSTGDNAAGAVFGFSESRLVFIDCLFDGNTYFGAGAGVRVSRSTLYIHGSQFVDNRNNISGHTPGATGAAVHTFDSTTRITNSRFVGNRTALAGAAVYGIGTWIEPFNVPSNVLVIANSTFIDNIAEPAPGQTTISPTEGGAIQLEDQTHLDLYNSRLLETRAELGGGFSIFRSTAVVEGTVFRGNVAASSSASAAFGGAIKVSSDDGAGDGATNFPSSELTIRDSLIQGRFNSVSTVARAGGGIFVAGDASRAFGVNGVSPMGGIAGNRATLVVERVVFHDLDVDFGGSTPRGGGLNTSLANVTITDSIFIGCDAQGSNGTGGGIFAQGNAVLSITGSTFAENTAASEGGAIHLLGAHLDVSSSHFLRNEVSPGTSESLNASLGAAIASGFQENFLGQGALDFDATGNIDSNVFSNQIGLALFERDRTSPPINAIRYGDNDFFESTFGDDVFRSTAAAANPQTPAELNSLVISHSGTADVAKSSATNTELGSQPTIAAARAVPPSILTPAATGDAAASTDSFVAYAWDGGSATFDGAGIAEHQAVEQESAGDHTLSVDGVDAVANVGSGPNPAGIFVSNPVMISSGESATLEWTTTGGSFIDLVLDDDLGAGNTANGTVVVSPPLTRSYPLCLVTRQGGAVLTATTFVDELPPDEVFSDGFESGNAAAWSAIISP